MTYDSHVDESLGVVDGCSVENAHPPPDFFIIPDAPWYFHACGKFCNKAQLQLRFKQVERHLARGETKRLIGVKPGFAKMTGGLSVLFAPPA